MHTVLFDSTLTLFVLLLLVLNRNDANAFLAGTRRVEVPYSIRGGSGNGGAGPSSQPLQVHQQQQQSNDLMSDSFAVGVLGDLHIDPRFMEDYEIGRRQWVEILKQHQMTHDNNVAMVSLGDLGESKSVRPSETHELFAGTTECHEMAAAFLSSFGVPYEVVGGNHGSFFAPCHVEYINIYILQTHNLVFLSSSSSQTWRGLMNLIRMLPIWKCFSQHITNQHPNSFDKLRPKPYWLA
jgi:hypothetical protein